LDLSCAQIATRMSNHLWQQDFTLALAGVYEDHGDLKKAISAHTRASSFEKEWRTRTKAHARARCCNPPENFLFQSIRLSMPATFTSARFLHI
jgi:hypothetical protein